MSSSRLDLLKEMVSANPSDAFLRYGLAMELKNGGQLEDAWHEFDALIRTFPEYVAAYLHAGNTLVALGRKDQAADVWRAGIAAAQNKRDFHAKGELEAALAGLTA